MSYICDRYNLLFRSFSLVAQATNCYTVAKRPFNRIQHFKRIFLCQENLSLDECSRSICQFRGRYYSRSMNLFSKLYREIMTMARKPPIDVKVVIMGWRLYFSVKVCVCLCSICIVDSGWLNIQSILPFSGKK